MKRLLPAIICAIFAIPTGLPAQEPPCCDLCGCTTVPDAVQGITARELGAHMTFLASDLMRGRDTASPEIRLAGEYLATRLQALGAEPAGVPDRDGKSYFQPFPLEYVTPKAEGTSMALVIEQDGARRVLPWTLFADFSVSPYGLDPGEAEAPVVFAGHGLVDEKTNYDDYADLDVRNRFVLVLDGLPRGDDGDGEAPPFLGQRTSHADKRENAQKRGALGLIIVRKPDEAPRLSNRSQADRERSFGQPRMVLGGGPSRIPLLILMDHARDSLAEAADLDLSDADPGPRALDGLRVRFTFAADRTVKHARNVIGLFPGSDPEKKKEVVIFSAHYDHVGVDEQGQIYNGSDDNASGTSALLEIAQAIADGPRPSRSVAFLWVSGEEKGLLGSAYFADHIPLPDGSKIVADINLDMVSRNDGHSVGITPSEKHDDYSTLIPAAQAALKEEQLEARFNADAFYARTDSYNFAKKGIPIIFFFSGIHDDYHKPTDDVDKADFDKAARIARAAYRLGWRVAQAPEAPKKIPAPSLAESEPDAPAPATGKDVKKPAETK